MIYGTETWAKNAGDLGSLEGTELMMMRWMCRVSLKDRKRSEDLCDLLGNNCVADVVRRGGLGWVGHLERQYVATACSLYLELISDQQFWFAVDISNSDSDSFITKVGKI